MEDPKEIELRCDQCKREASYARWTEGDIPDEVATIVVSRCLQCDNGDFGTEWWLDAAGNEVSQDVLTPTRSSA